MLATPIKTKKMKKLTILLIAICFITFSSCTNSDDEVSGAEEVKCGFHNGNQLWKGPQGGCYYYNDNGNKTYVERSECNC